MASSVLKRNWNLSDALTEHFKHKCDFSDALTEQYFHLVYKKYGIPFPDDASWKEVKIPSLNGHTKTFNEIPNMLFDIADMFEDARVEELVKKCERLQLNSGNLYAQFNGTITVLLDKELTWGKVVVFFAFAVSFAIYLCTNDKSHLSARVCGWAAHVLRSRLLPWIDANGGWESFLKFGADALARKDPVKRKAALKTLGQAGVVLGVFAVAAFTIKQIFS